MENQDYGQLLGLIDSNAVKTTVEREVKKLNLFGDMIKENIENGDMTN